ncbi:MAG: PAS domain-containing sensor histidine kinase [Betaproteobacteria bacterium]|nr:PAS domain-containing sensor histidine kinase [Betaproteobacteria bacterium]
MRIDLSSDANPERSFALMRDIADRKRAEEALAKSEARYRSLFENMLHGFAYCRMLFEDNRPQDFIYLDVNIAFEQLTGLKNVVGKRVTEVIPGIREAHPELFETYGRVTLTGQPERFEIYFKPLKSWLSIAAYNITARKRAEQERRDYAGRLRRLSRRLFAVEETERRSINRELHDRIGQSLSALNINLNIIRSQLPRESLDVVGARFRDTQTLLEGTAVQIRDIMANLHPPALDDYGLLAALRTHVESLGARVAVSITVHGEDFTPRLPLAVETALFRIAQEALANAIKHARARNIEVALGATPERVTLTIADDGVGFAAEHTKSAGNHWGLATMRERADTVGAKLRIESPPGRGVHVIVEIPRRAA